MDRHAEWIKAQYELSEASKAVHHWDAMPKDVQVRLGIGRYRERRAEARRRFKEADKLCRAASIANRVALRVEIKRGGQIA